MPKYAEEILAAVTELQQHPTAGDRRYNTLFRYVITENHMENGKFVIEGHHTQVNEISASLRKCLLENGMPNEELQALLNPKKEVNAT